MAGGRAMYGDAVCAAALICGPVRRSCDRSAESLALTFRAVWKIGDASHRLQSTVRGLSSHACVSAARLRLHGLLAMPIPGRGSAHLAASTPQSARDAIAGGFQPDRLKLTAKRGRSCADGCVSQRFARDRPAHQWAIRAGAVDSSASFAHGLHRRCLRVYRRNGRLDLTHARWVSLKSPLHRAIVPGSAVIHAYSSPLPHLIPRCDDARMPRRHLFGSTH